MIMGVKFPKSWNDSSPLSSVKCKEFRLFFEKGSFDEWCVYTYDSRKKKLYFPLDEDYLTWIKNLGMKYGYDEVYSDFIYIYEKVVDGVTSKECYDITKKVDSHYDEDTQVWWIIFFMTMYAECMKKNSILKKRIKHLAVYNVLVEGDEIEYVTQYMKNTEHLSGWYKYLDKLMVERGI